MAEKSVFVGRTHSTFTRRFLALFGCRPTPGRGSIVEQTFTFYPELEVYYLSVHSYPGNRIEIQFKASKAEQRRVYAAVRGCKGYVASRLRSGATLGRVVVRRARSANGVPVEVFGVAPFSICT